MTSFILATLLLAFGMATIVIRKTYYATPVTELRRRAQQGDKFSKTLYRAVAFQSSLRGLLWIALVVSSAVGFVLLVRVAPIWLSVGLYIVLFWVAWSWIPGSRVTGIGARLTTVATPSIVWFLNYLHPVLSRGTTVVEKRYTAPKHSGIYERDDLIAIIDRQLQQPDNRVTAEELEIASRALHFADHQVADVLTPRKQIKTINADATIGPILIDELHKSGEEVVLVQDGKKGPIVGSLAFTHLDLKSTGTVRDVMDDSVYFVHEDDSLSEALHAFFVTNRPLFVVVNSAEDYVGIISVQTILEQLLGHVPGNDFDQYADSTAVAHRHHRPKTVEKSDEVDLEVIE